MSRTVTALYDTKAEAEAARDRLTSEFDVEGRAKIMDGSSVPDGSVPSDFHDTQLSQDDREVYSEGLRRGGFMLCAEVDEDEEADRIVSVLKQTASIDLADRQTKWRSEGWAGGAGTEDAEVRDASIGQRGKDLRQD